MYPVVGRDVRIARDPAAQDVLADQGDEHRIDEIVVERVGARDAGERHRSHLDQRVAMFGRTPAKGLAVVLAQPRDERVDDDVRGAEHVPSKHVPMFLGEDV